jgi:hypothetical protein
MLQTFYIKEGATLPILRMELIDDGLSDFRKFHQAIQNAEITFTMVNDDTGVTKIAHAPAYIKLRESNTCFEEYLVCYNWKKRDTNEIGNFTGTFEITFGSIKNDDGTTYPNGMLIMPIRESLRIVISQ